MAAAGKALCSQVVLMPVLQPMSSSVKGAAMPCLDRYVCSQQQQ
jgi:hypothetical protein